MKNRFQVLLVISAFAVTSFVQIMQFDSFNAFAQQLELQESDVETNPNSEFGAIQLHKFSIWDKLEITTMGYLNPLGKSDKSVIYSYEFADNEDVAKALSVIFDSEIVMLVDTWYIGKIETVQYWYLLLRNWAFPCHKLADTRWRQCRSILGAVCRVGFTRWSLLPAIQHCRTVESDNGDTTSQRKPLTNRYSVSHSHNLVIVRLLRDYYISQGRTDFLGR